MYLHEDIALLMAKERMEDAMHFAEQRRACRRARAPRQPARLRLGMALVRFGHWIMGQEFHESLPHGLRLRADGS